MTLFMALSVSSFTHFPSASGSDVSLFDLESHAKFEQKSMKSFTSATHETFKCFNKVKFPMSTGSVTKQFSDRSKVLRTFGNSRSCGGNSWNQFYWYKNTKCCKFQGHFKVSLHGVPWNLMKWLLPFYAIHFSPLAFFEKFSALQFAVLFQSVVSLHYFPF